MVRLNCRHAVRSNHGGQIMQMANGQTRNGFKKSAIPKSSTKYKVFIEGDSSKLLSEASNSRFEIKFHDNYFMEIVFSSTGNPIKARRKQRI